MPRSPLRYPGGKQKAIKQIASFIPQRFLEFREPLVGGGAMMFYLAETYPQLPCWINDLNQELYMFWHQVKENLPQLIARIKTIKQETQQGRTLFNQFSTIDPTTLNPTDRAARFFILNRITFSGTIESGGYSQASYESRFTDSSIQRLANLEGYFTHIRVTNYDYSELIHAPGEEVFIFLDPPYLSKTRSKLYGRKGDLHTYFDHDRFANLLLTCRHQWLITYDDCEQVRDNFSSAFIYPWELQYGMNNYKQTKALKGKELLICNYPIGSLT